MSKRQQDLDMFWINFDRALEEAHKIVSNRSVVRDAAMFPWEKMCFGEKSFITMIFHKCARLVSMLQRKEATELQYFGLEEKIDDELLDIMNYCAMMWAYRRQEEHRLETEGPK